MPSTVCRSGRNKKGMTERPSRLTKNCSGAIGRNFGPELTGAVELWAARNDDPAGRLTQASFDLGLAWIPLKDQNLQFDAGANFGLTRDTPDVNVYVGVSRRF